MSDRVVQSHCDGHRKPVHSSHSYQSAWMAHWTRTSSNTEPHVNTHISPGPQSRQYDNDAKQQSMLSMLDKTSHISSSTKRVKEVTEVGTVKVMNDNVATSSKSLAVKRFDCEAFPIVDLRQSFGSRLAPENDQETSFQRLALSSDIGCNFESNTNAVGTSLSHFPSAHAEASHAAKSSFRDSHYGLEGISNKPGDPGNSVRFIEDSSLSIARPSQKNSVPLLVPYISSRGRTPIISRYSQEGANQLSSILASKEGSSDANLIVKGHEHCNYQSRSELLVCKKELDMKSNSTKSGSSFLRQNNGPLSLRDTSACNHVREQFREMHNCPNIEFFPSRSSPPEATKSEQLHHGFYSLQQQSHSVHNVERTRICTTVDSVDDFPGVPPKYSHTTHSLLITKTDVNWSKENQTFRESRLSTKVRGNMYGDFLSLSSVFGQGRGGVKLQSLGSSADTEAKDNFEVVKNSEFRLRNESSVDTDTMDMDSFKEKNYTFGQNSSSSNKDIKVGRDLLSEPLIASTSEEVGCRWPITRIPDTNEEFHAIPAAANSVDLAEPSTSRTQSLDADQLLTFAEQPGSLNSSPSLDGFLRPEPSNRWIKRLRLSSENTRGFGTKSSNLGESSYHEKVNKVFNKVLQASTTSSEPTLGSRHGKEPVGPDQTMLLLRKDEPHSMPSMKRSRDELFSHSWFQRWCRNQGATLGKKAETVVACEPQNSKVALDDFQKQQFPSIAAMALMGKFMRGFQPCEFQNRGSFVVWNTPRC